jgi:hypothetical protein
MMPASSGVQILSRCDIAVSLQDLDVIAGTADNRRRILETAGKLIVEVQSNWSPRAIIRWLRVARVTDNRVLLTPFDNGEGKYLHLGVASKFMVNAERGVVGVYSAGDELEQAAARASREKRYVDAFLYDLIGLAVLKKTKQQIDKIVEEEARKNNWGVGPFLSPGSVHGWDLADQANLCSLVPLNRINLELKSNNIFRPFKTISFLIGTGPKYDAKVVGSTCDVCAKSQNCALQRSQADPTKHE